MKVKYSLLAVAGAMALVGAGCSSTTNTGLTPTNSDTASVSNPTTNVGEENAEVTSDTSEENVVVTTQSNFAVGDAVMVDLGYGWYEGKVEDYPCDAGVYVSYKGLSASCMTEDKLTKSVAPSASALVTGAKVIANIGKGEMFGGKTIFPFYNAEITAVNGSTYTVKNTSNKTFDVTIDKIYLK